jgi:hypothetical protein
MTTIEEMALKAADKKWGRPDPHDYTDHSGCGAAHSNYNVGYTDGAKAVLEEIENFMKGLDLGNSAVEKFFKLVVLADIGLFIEQLKK